MARILRANLNQPRRDSGIPHESASGAFGIRRAFKDVKRAYFVYPMRPGLVEATANYAQAAVEAKAEFISTCHKGRLAPIRMMLRHLRSIRLIRAELRLCLFP
jgi:hypothetical protein